MATWEERLNSAIRGIEEGRFGTWLQKLWTVVTELVADHATTRALQAELAATVAANRVLALELKADHATFITLTDALKTATNGNITAITELITWAETLAAKLNLDGGVTDQDYDADITAEAPAAVTASPPEALAAADPAALTESPPATLTATMPVTLAA